MIADNQIEVPLYLKLTEEAARLLITTKSIRRYHHKVYKDTDHAFQFSIVGLHKVTNL